MSGSVDALRWMVKKASRYAVSRAGMVLRARSPRQPRVRTPMPQDDSHHASGQAHRRVVRALTYHRFGIRPRDAFCVSPDAFDQQMRYLARGKLAISLDELQAFIGSRATPAADAALVTIDDGFVSTLTHAVPILKEYGVPAVAFVSAGQVGWRAQHREHGPEDSLDWRQLERLVRAGISVQSHGWSHRSLAFLSPREIDDELEHSRALLSSRLGCDVLAFAYPFGTRADFNPAVAAAVAKAGYRLAFASQHGPIRPGDDPYVLNRTKVEGGEGLSTFRALVHGGLDAWRWVDRSLWRLQASRRAAG